jgi:hypothetical protein
MKYLKLFESFDDSNLKEDIKDIFLELEDEGYTINLKEGWRFSDSHEIQISKGSGEYSALLFWQEEFLLRNICDSILVLKSYLKDTEYYIYEVKGYGKNNMRRVIERDIAWVKNIDPNINFQESDEALDISLVEIEIIIRKRK